MKLKITTIDLELTRHQKVLAVTLMAIAATAVGASVAVAEVPVTFTPGQQLTAADLNQNFSEFDSRVAALQVSLEELESEQVQRLEGVDADIVGISGSPVNPATSQMLWQAGSTVVNTDASGLATVPFPTPFPSGLLTVVTTIGDVTCGNGVVQPPYSGSSFTYHTSANGLCRINWIAFGW